MVSDLRQGDLLSTLSGHATYIEQSIVNHISLLLNTRKESLNHMPEYGLPLYSYEIDNKKNFMLTLKNLIEAYEPRINNIEILELEALAGDCVLRIQLSASLTVNNKTLNMNAELCSSGKIQVHKL